MQGNRQKLYEEVVNTLIKLKKKNLISINKRSCLQNQPKTLAQLTNRITELKKQREAYSTRISRLIALKEYTYLVDNHSAQRLEIMAPQQNNKIVLGEKERINEGQINNFVNFFVNVDQPAKQTHIIELYGLYLSLLQMHPQSQITLQPLSSFRRFNAFIQTSRSFSEVVAYLQDNQLFDGMFIEKVILEGQLRVSYSSSLFIIGHFQQILLSQEKIDSQQIKYLQYEFDEREDIICIRYLLLKRLLQYRAGLQKIEEIPSPILISWLLGYPYRVFRIASTMDYLQFCHFVKQDNEEFSITGYDFSTGSSTRLSNNYLRQSPKDFSRQMLQYSQIIVSKESQLQVQAIPLMCLRHHHVVLDIIIESAGQYYCSVGSEQQSSKQKYKICIIDSHQQIITYGIVRNGEFIKTHLEIDEYQMYVSPISCNNATYQVFCLWIQGDNLFSTRHRTDIQVTLKQKYDTFSEYIVSLYLAKYSRVMAHEQQKKALLADNIVVVTRIILDFLYFCVDYIQSPENGSCFVISYSQNILCDKLHSKNTLEFKGGSQQRIIISKDVPIKYIVSDGAQVSYRVFKVAL